MRSILKAELDTASMQKKLKKVARAYNEGQKQAVKRWGVQVCRDLAKYTQAFGSKPRAHKGAMILDAANVLFTHKGKAQASRTGKTMIYEMKGRRHGVSVDRYLSSEEEVIRWIDRYRTRQGKRTTKLPPSQKAVCSNALFKRAINQKHKTKSGMAKDGWLDAADMISRRQKGRNPARIGESFMKFARKPKKLGHAKEGSRFFKALAFLTNRVQHSKSKYVIDGSDKMSALRDGYTNTMKWYTKTIKAENKKRK